MRRIVQNSGVAESDAPSDRPRPGRAARHADRLGQAPPLTMGTVPGESNRVHPPVRHVGLMQRALGVLSHEVGATVAIPAAATPRTHGLLGQR